VQQDSLEQLEQQDSLEPVVLPEQRDLLEQQDSPEQPVQQD
jgi:hypothetical protein